MTTARDRPPEEAAEDTSFARGLRVLLTIADRGEIRADELSVLLETPLSTIYRYLRTLTEFGFVERSDGGYRLGPRLLIGGGTNVSSEELIRLRRSRSCDPLAEETGETAVISRRVGLSAVCLHTIPSRQPLRVNLEPGQAMSLHEGAIAKVLLAYAPADIVDEMLGQARRPPGLHRRELRKELASIAAAGIARSDDDPIPGSVTIAVPVIREDGIVAAIGIIGPETRCGLAWRARVSRLLPDAAAAIVGALGQAPRG